MSTVSLPFTASEDAIAVAIARVQVRARGTVVEPRDLAAAAHAALVRLRTVAAAAGVAPGELWPNGSVFLGWVPGGTTTVVVFTRTGLVVRRGQPAAPVPPSSTQSGVLVLTVGAR